MITNYWAYIGTLYLLILTYQDFKNNRDIDDRKNYFMMGITLSLISHFPTSFFYLLGLILGIVVLNILLKFTRFGAGDISAFRWVFLGFGLLQFNYLLWFMGILLVISGIHFFIKNIIFKKSEAEFQFFHIILISFVVNCLMWGLYF